MLILINCPCCGQEIKLYINNNEVESIEIGSTIILSEDNALEVAKKHGIEFG